MKRYTVQIAPAATEQIEDLTRHIGRYSPANALNWNARLLNAINRIGDMPGYAIDETGSEVTKKIVHKTNFERTYLIYEETHVVEIIDVRHGARRSRFERD